MPPWRISRTLPGSPVSIAEARRFVAVLLQAWPEIVDAELIISELATNAIRHSASGRFGGRFTVSVQIDTNRIWLGVLDQGGRRSPHPIPPQSDEEGGRGLALVDALAAYWGVTGDHTGRTVWAVLDLVPEKAAVC